MEKIFIIDAVNYLFRSYYAIGPMTNDKGQSTSALYGFIRSLKKLIKDFSPKYMVCVFDGPDNKKARQAAYADYKMHRKKAPDDLYTQFDLAFEYCKRAGIPTLCVEGVEADDTMGSIAAWIKNDMEVYLCTSDKDLFQMVGKNIYILLAHKNNKIVDPKEVKSMFGVSPEQIIDYLSITGDSSDNIPGLPGFGPKTASALLQKFHSLDEILKNPEKVPGKKKQETIKNEQEKALLSRELVTLDLKVPFPHEKEFFLLKPEEKKELLSFFQEMNFTSLQKEIKPAEEKEEKVSYKLINSKEKLEELIKLLSSKKEICIDTETTSLHPIEADLIGMGFCFEEKKGYYIPLNGSIERNIVLSAIKKLLENPKIKFYGHNIKYDINVLKNVNISLKKISFDTLLASYLIGPHHKKHGLDILSLEYFNKKKISYKELTTKNKKKIPLKEVDIEKVSTYCIEDVDYTYRLKEIFSKKLKEESLEKVFYDIEIPLIPILAKMERRGIYLDKPKFEKLFQKYSKELEETEKQIFKQAKEKFNINSPKQLSHILFEKLKMPLPKRKKTEYSTGAEVLKKLAPKYPLANSILQYRTTQKLISTYVAALPKQINKKTLRIHPTFNQSITSTGRLSCQDPNLQNIPTKTIRDGFKPQEDSWSYLSADYSQIELRLLAHFSGDEELLLAFKKKEDIHTYTASCIFHVPLKDVTKKMRKTAKAVNFGILYGQGPFGLSELVNIPYKMAKEFIEEYFKRYKKISPYIERTIQEARKTKFAKTLFGRKRPIFEIDNQNAALRSSAERLAINTPLQGTAADIIKLAMIEIDKEIEKQKLKGYMILQIHDELIFEIPDNEIVKFKTLVKKKMENVIKLSCDLTVDIRVGKNWGEC